MFEKNVFGMNALINMNLKMAINSAVFSCIKFELISIKEITLAWI